MRIAAMFALLCAGLSAQTASMDGTVVNSTSGEPVAGVHVGLTSSDIEHMLSYGAISDRVGHFSIASLKAGPYILIVERTGFLQARKPGESPIAALMLRPGERLADYKIEMTPRAVIAGRVVDEFGDPVEGADIRIAPGAPDAEPSPLTNSRVTTDDRGEFRSAVLPGKYYLKAYPRQRTSANQQEIRADGSTAAAYGPTWYPNAVTGDRAVAVQAIAGRDVTGMEIRLAAQRSLSLGGLVSGPGGATHGRVELDIVEGKRVDRYMTNETTLAGRFSFNGLRPGLYRLSAESASGNPRLLSPIVDIRLEASDESNVVLTLAPGGEIAGTLEIADAAAANRTVRLEPSDEGMPDLHEVVGGAVDPKGAFRLAGIPPGRFRVAVDSLPGDAYLKSVQLDDAAVPDKILDFSRGVHGSKMKITVGRNGGELFGRVLDKDGAVTASPFTMAILISEAGEETVDRGTAQGKYSFKGVPPGKYRVFAVDGLRYLDSVAPGTWKALGAHAEEIEVHEGERIAKDVKLEAGDADAKQ